MDSFFELISYICSFLIEDNLLGNVFGLFLVLGFLALLYYGFFGRSYK